jgi:hypothetical protein
MRTRVQGNKLSNFPTAYGAQLGVQFNQFQDCVFIHFPKLSGNPLFRYASCLLASPQISSLKRRNLYRFQFFPPLCLPSLYQLGQCGLHLQYTEECISYKMWMHKLIQVYQWKDKYFLNTFCCLNVIRRSPKENWYCFATCIWFNEGLWVYG